MPTWHSAVAARGTHTLCTLLAFLSIAPWTSTHIPALSLVHWWPAADAREALDRSWWTLWQLLRFNKAVPQQRRHCFLLGSISNTKIMDSREEKKKTPAATTNKTYCARQIIRSELQRLELKTQNAFWHVGFCPCGSITSHWKHNFHHITN